MQTVEHKQVFIPVFDHEEDSEFIANYIRQLSDANVLLAKKMNTTSSGIKSKVGFNIPLLLSILSKRIMLKHVEVYPYWAVQATLKKGISIGEMARTMWRCISAYEGEYLAIILKNKQLKRELRVKSICSAISLTLCCILIVVLTLVFTHVIPV